MILGNSAFAQTYIGEVCWLTGSPDEEEDDSGVAVFGVTEQGDNHFILNGQILDDDSDDDTASKLVTR